MPTGMPPDKSPVNQITFDEYRSAVNRWAEQVALELKTQAEKIESLEKYLRGGGKTVLQNSKDPPDYSKWFNEDEDGLEVGYDGWPERRKF